MSVRSRPDTVGLWTRAADQPGEHPVRLAAGAPSGNLRLSPSLGPMETQSGEPLSNPGTQHLAPSAGIAQRAGCGKGPGLGPRRKTPLSRVLFNHLSIKWPRHGCNKP